MKLVYWAVMLLAFTMGCVAHSLTHDALTQPPPAECASCTCAEEVEILHARVVAVEERLEVHRYIIRLLRNQLGLREQQE